MGDIDKALEVLEQGNGVTMDERLRQYFDTIDYDEKETVFDSTESKNNIERSDDIERIIEIVRYVVPMESYHQVGAYYLTYEQLKAAYYPFIEELEKYININQNDEEAWEVLSWIYLHTGQMEHCLKTRQKRYELTGSKRLFPETHTETYVNGNVIYDEYGRIIEFLDSEVYTFGEGDRFVTVRDYTYPNSLWQYEYDSLGRVIKTTCSGALDSVTEYEYEDDNSVLIHENTFRDWYIDRVIYDEYGQIQSRENIEFGSFIE